MSGLHFLVYFKSFFFLLQILLDADGINFASLRRMVSAQSQIHYAAKLLYKYIKLLAMLAMDSNSNISSKSNNNGDRGTLVKHKTTQKTEC